MSRPYNSRKGKSPRHPAQADNRLLKSMRRLKPGRPQDEERLSRMSFNKLHLELDARERRATKVLAAVLDDPMFVNHRTVTGRCVVHIKDGMV